MRDIPGYRFRNNKLYDISCGDVMVLEAWPVLKAVRRENDGDWEEFEPWFRVVRPCRPRKVKQMQHMDLPFDFIPTRSLLSDQCRRAFDRFRLSIPTQVANSAAEKHHTPTAAMMETMLEILVLVAPATRNPKIQSLAKLRTMHREVYLKYLDLQQGRSDDPHLPPPPLTGTPDIEPIRTALALVLEGKPKEIVLPTTPNASGRELPTFTASTARNAPHFPSSKARMASGESAN